MDTYTLGQEADTNGQGVRLARHSSHDFQAHIIDRPEEGASTVGDQVNRALIFRSRGGAKYIAQSVR